MEREALSGIFWERPTFWVAVAFVLFFVLFGKRLFAALTAMLDARAAAIRHELEEAARLRREAEDMLREATRKRETALAEANALLEKAEIEAARLAQAIREEAEANAKRREEMAHMRIAAAEKAALAELRRATTDVAIIAAREVIAHDLTAEAGSALVDQAIAGLPSALRAA
ncbi:MAG: F0F1 ATP synthase subunit B [Acidibrevibacterium sp.]|jgi:F-type H+-transporting ATPase subunit b|uniref:F0F1 ATP synthase subunit B family protein n=1 Tax=Acidibrevibacterium fodinaquatile TaxID=1969806 RepID=UPI0023A8E1A5|nr:F0F1 ATP synthase subunit B [Acidibrevibacterium fodinaquatile]MCA7120407.1 F0F1 ATP synthase subunit B [Acidibrevibacterium fodinaquatile]